MADQKISELTNASSGNLTDELPIVQAGVTKRLTLGELKAAVGVQERWTLIASSNYTATPASTSQITMSETELMSPGLPLKYTYDGNTYYGRVNAVTTDTNITIQGAPLDTNHDLTALYVGTPEMVVQVNCFVAGTYGDGAGDLLNADMNAAMTWQLTTAYLVAFGAKHATDDGTANPKINVKVGGNVVSTNDSNNGIQVDDVWVANPAVAINTTSYVCTRGESLEVACTAAGTDGDAADLSVEAVFVLG